MCGFCDQAEVEKPCDDEGFGTVTADLGETGYTIPGDVSTTETITIGGVREETLDFAGDTDWFQITFNAGDSIRIDLTGVDHDAGNGLGALADTYLRLRDASGNVVAFDDDGGPGLNSSLSGTITTGGTYYIEVDSYANAYAGDYRLEVTAITPPPPPTPVGAVQGANALDDSGPIMVYFAQAGDTYTYNANTYTATGVNAWEQSQMWSIFEGVEAFADIDFQVTTDRAAADLEWATDVLPSSASGTLLGFFFFPDAAGNGGYGVLNNNSGSFPYWNSAPGGTFDTGGFMYGVAIHELGHGLGLGHPHDSGNGTQIMSGVTGSGDRGDFDLNSAPYTAMSYNEGSLIAGVAGNTASTGHGATFGALDIAALQAFYGANTTHAAGDDTYDLDSSNTTGSGAGYYTIWDTSGTDLMRYLGTADATLDLRAATLEYEVGGGGFISYVDGVIGGRTIANGVVIENATSGSGDDTLNGNAMGNRLDGGQGDDTLNGLEGDDQLFGRGGDDTLNGGDNNDKIIGGRGTDTINGGDGRDTLRGGRDGDIIDGGEGNDRVQGGSGGDTLEGGNGNDMVDYAGSSGAVTVDLSTNTVSGGDAAGDTISGFERIRGSSFDDTLTGDSGRNTILGGNGGDTIDGGTNNDVLNGQGGDDTFLFATGDGNDTIDGGGDTDTCDYTGFDSTDFTIVDLAGANWTVTEIATGHIDTLSSIEVLVFDDMTLVA
ncbi:pre-peptidase C-terminal domain-containing protein [Seohaeicola saemankumensis]|nr:pre-peptidase C-terminal domain-containing protein [Seohaeicola saemankumensis]MCA0872342.1 pre-peptidase C-terminal domain-containing protein [Seohaeicola saemankumensis]